MLRTHRQRVPAMLAVACVGMMVYAVAGAAPDDGQQLAPAAKTTSTTAKDGKGSTPPDDCKGSTSTTRKDGGGKGTTSTTRKDDDGKNTTSTTAKDGDGDGKGTTSTTRKDDDGKNTTSTTAKDRDDGDDDKSTTSTTKKDGDDNVSTKKAAFNTAAADKDTTGPTPKGDAGKAAADDDCEPTTSTTDKGGKGSTTTTRKSGDGKDDGKNTTTTERKDRPTTTTTRKTVEPTSPPSGGGPDSGGGDSGGSTDPGATPIEPQEAPPFDPGVDEPADDPDAGAGSDEGDWYEMPEEGPVEMDGDEYAFGPLPAPGEAQPMFPTLKEHNPRAGGKASVSSDRSSGRRNRDRSRDQESAAAPFVMSSSGAVQAAPGQTQSAAVRRNLGGLQSSVTESAFPADIISTPKIFPINRRDPLAAAALVLLVGVSRELFKAWRRRASTYWPA